MRIFSKLNTNNDSLRNRNILHTGKFSVIKCEEAEKIWQNNYNKTNRKDLTKQLQDKQKRNDLTTSLITYNQCNRRFEHKGTLILAKHGVFQVKIVI